ncbi:MAG: universal stress protein [Nitrososphaeraceae archaeon]
MDLDNYEKILTCVDGSENSIRAAYKALSLSIQYKSELTILSVVPSQIRSGDSSGVFGMVTENYLNNYKKEATKWFQKIKEKIKEDDKPHTIREDVISSPLSTAGAIIDYAEQNEVDLIVIGTRGRTGFKKLLLGSTADSIVTYSNCSVLIVK